MNRFILDLYRVAVQLNALSHTHRKLFEQNNALKKQLYFDIPYIDDFKRFASILNFSFEDKDIVIEYTICGEIEKIYFIPNFLLEEDIECIEKWFFDEIERIKKEIEEDKEDKA